MSNLQDDDLQQHTYPGSYGYSATPLDNLGATSYTIVDIEADNSGSVREFAAEINRCIHETVDACRNSPMARVDNLMLRVGRFDTNIEEHHGFKLLANCKGDDYNHVVTGRGITKLYDAAFQGVSAITGYGQQLADADFSVNAILVVITDGWDDNGYGQPASVNTPKSVGVALNCVVTGEKVESLVSILVGVGLADADVARRLDTFAKEAGFTQFIDAGKVDAKTMAKLAEFISKSVSSQSQALGTNMPSKALSF